MKTKEFLMFVFASMFSLSFVSAQYPYGMMGGYGYSSIGMIFGWIFMGLILIILILLIAWLIKQLQKDERRRR